MDNALPLLAIQIDHLVCIMGRMVPCPLIFQPRQLQQGCLLFHFFNLFMNHLKHALTGNQFHTPILNDSIPVLLQVDHALLVSQSQVGLQRLLAVFQQYCISNSLEINTSKGRVLILGEEMRKSVCFLQKKKLEVVSLFKYLGIYYNKTSNWNKHFENVSIKVKQVFGGVLSFYNKKGRWAVLVSAKHGCLEPLECLLPPPVSDQGESPGGQSR